ncbi:hypothetical protein K2X33_15280 [bacterium]|nr:hypothetical protein [bacterium]
MKFYASALVVFLAAAPLLAADPTAELLLEVENAECLNGQNECMETMGFTTPNTVFTLIPDAKVQDRFIGTARVKEKNGLGWADVKLTGWKEKDGSIGSFTLQAVLTNKALSTVSTSTDVAFETVEEVNQITVRGQKTQDAQGGYSYVYLRIRPALSDDDRTIDPELLDEIRKAAETQRPAAKQLSPDQSSKIRALQIEQLTPEENARLTKELGRQARQLPPDEFPTPEENARLTEKLARQSPKAKPLTPEENNEARALQLGQQSLQQNTQLCPSGQRGWHCKNRLRRRWR